MEYFKSTDGETIIGLKKDGSIVEFESIGKMVQDVPEIENGAKKKGKCGKCGRPGHRQTTCGRERIQYKKGKGLLDEQPKKVSKIMWSNIKGRQHMDDPAGDTAERYEVGVDVVNEVYGSTNYEVYLQN